MLSLLPASSRSRVTCEASSRVGAITRARGLPWLIGLSAASAMVCSRCSRELPKASVFPVPVRAWPIKSVPLKANGMAIVWMGNGWTMPAAASAPVISSRIPRSAKVSVAVVVSLRMKT